MFQKKKTDETPKICAYCEYAKVLPTADGEENDMICEKKGVVRADHACRKFKYDLLKRAPKEKPRLDSLAAVVLDD